VARAAGLKSARGPSPPSPGEGPPAARPHAGAQTADALPERSRAGFAALVGRPNAGKSTLLNRLVGEKLAIVSPRPQTTRNRITGIRNLPGVQVVFVDTPGLHPPSGPLGEFMMKTAERALEDVDLVCAVVDATAREHPDALVLATLARTPAPAFCLLNKADAVEPKARILPLIDTWRAAHPFREILPLSALDGTNCDRLLALVADAMPEHPPYFPPDTMTDVPETFYVAEVVREKVFLQTHQEIPYAVAVTVDELVERRRPERLDIRATIFVERDSQKGILIGKGGGMLKRIGIAAREELERFFGIKVFLGLNVRVRRAWRTDDRALREFGFRLTS
jgi:GTP-binding protein Era